MRFKLTRVSSRLILATAAVSLASSCGGSKKAAHATDGAATGAQVAEKSSSDQNDMGAVISKKTDETNQKLDENLELNKTIAGDEKSILKVATDTQHTAENQYRDARPVMSEQARMQAYQTLRNAKGLADKRTAAEIYVGSFEFQAWKNQGADTPARLNELLTAAFQEFCGHLSDLTEKQELDISPTRTDQRMLDLYALSLALDQADGTISKDKAPLSLLSVIHDTLGKSADIDSGKVADQDVKEYEHIIRRNQASLVYLLELRANVLPALALAQVSGNATQPGFWHSLSRLHVKSAFKGALQDLHFKPGHWDSQAATMDKDQLDELTRLMTQANRERDFIATLGQGKFMSKSVFKAFQKMHEPGISEDQAKAPAGDGRSVALDGFSKAVEQYLSMDASLLK